MTNKDVIITRLLRQNEQLNRQVQLLTEENQKLRDKIARLEKNSSNSSKPPSSDIISPHPPNAKKKKRKIRGQKGHPKHSRPQIFRHVKLKIPVIVLTSTALMFINPSFSAMVCISHIKSAQVSNDESFQEFHKTETSIPKPFSPRLKYLKKLVS